MVDLDRRGFLNALLAAGAGAALPACVTVPSHDPRVEEAIRRELGSGRISVFSGGAVGGPDYCFGGARSDSLFEIASVSKTFTALMTAVLQAEGLIDIDAPFVRYLPDHVLAREGSPITVRDLATHVSGFTNDWMGPAGIYGGGPWPYADDAAYERAVLSVRPSFAPRARCVYSCHNYILLGLLLERVSGLDLDTLSRQKIWAPLGMRSTTWRNLTDTSRAVRIWTNGWCPLGTKGDENARGVEKPLGNAGVFSSLDDLRLYARDLLERRTFPKAVYDLLFTPTAEYGGTRRSFGWAMSAGAVPPGWSASSICHSGYTGQYVSVDPVGGRAVVLLSDLSAAAAKERSANYEFRRTLAAALCARGGRR